MEEVKRRKAKKRLIRVTFPDGQVICYKNATDTMITTLQKLGSDVLGAVKLEMCYLPLLSKEIYPKYKDWMKPINDEWYVNTQSDSGTKFLQLRAINAQLDLGLVIDIGTDFEAQDNPNREKHHKAKNNLLVKFPDGQYFANSSSLDTFLEVIWQLGVDEIKKKDLSWGGNPFITTYKMFNNQVQVGSQCWLTVPNSTKDKVKMLRVIGAKLHINIEITMI